MKKGYYDYVPIVKKEKEVIQPTPEGDVEPKYITNMSGHSFMISDSRGMVVGSTDILMFGNRIPTYGTGRPLSPNSSLDTKSYIKYSGHL
jgi:hypothetical protein